MMQFIHDHYMEEITLEQIAASASLSKSGALHIFRSGIQISPVAYLIRYRLAQAAEQLQTTRKSVSSVAADTGFADAGLFLPEIQAAVSYERRRVPAKKRENHCYFRLLML